MSDMFGAIGDGINQDKGFVFGLLNNAISYRQSKSAQARAYNYARALQQQQYDLTQQGYRDAPGNKRAGLESAGYNPMLALDGINSSSTISGGTPVGANATDSADLAGNALTIQRIANETKTSDSVVENNEAQAELARANASGQTLRNKYIDAQSKAQISNTEASTRKMDAEIDNMEKFQQFEQIRLELQRLGILKNYEASIYGSNASANASRYGAKTSYWSSIYNADSHRRSTIPGNASYLGDKAERALSRLFKRR